MDQHKRSVAKTITFRILATILTMVLVYIFTGEWLASIGIGVADFASKLLLYYFHERAWDKIKWGTKK
jgi:uncharacterized membrane protein